jgi:hypothetical protein
MEKLFGLEMVIIACVMSSILVLGFIILALLAWSHRVFSRWVYDQSRAGRSNPC